MDAWITLWVGVPPEKYFAGAVSGSSPSREDGENKMTKKEIQKIKIMWRGAEIGNESISITTEDTG